MSSQPEAKSKRRKGDSPLEAESKRCKRNGYTQVARMKAQQVDAFIHPAAPDPEPYRIDFSVIPGSALETLKAYLERLDANSHEATSNGISVTLKKLKRMGGQSKTLLLLRDLNAISPFYQSSEEEHLIKVDEEEHLKTVLTKGDGCPIRIQGALASHLCPNLSGYSISWFVQKVLGNPEAVCSVVDYSSRDLTTRQGTVQEIKEHFHPVIDPDVTLNYLDISNRTGIQFTPAILTQFNLLRNIGLVNARDISKSANEISGNEFFLLTTARGCSPAHIDEGGKWVYIIVLAGRKIFYTQRRDERNMRIFCEFGPQHPEDFREGWARHDLPQGTLFIMPPGTPHAVYTVEPSLCVGGHFYTSSEMDTSIDVVKAQETYPEICNEDLSFDTYQSLATIISAAVTLLNRDECLRLGLALKEYLRVRLEKRTARKKSGKGQEDPSFTLVNAIRDGRIIKALISKS